MPPDERDALKPTDIATFILDGELRLVRHSAGMSSMFEISHADDRDVLGVLGQRLRLPLADAARGVLQTMEPFETHVATSANAHVLARIVPGRATDGRVEGLVLTLVDVSALKRTETELRESEIVQDRYRVIVEAARDYAIISVDQDGTIVSWSPGAEATFGWSAPEAVGRPIAMTFTPEDRQRGVPAAELSQALSTGFAPDRRWHQRHDGSRVFIEGSARALPTVTGQSVVFKIGKDVTRRLELEDELRELNQALEQRVADRTQQLTSTGIALRESDARYRILFEAMDQGFCVIEVIVEEGMPVDYRFLEVNPSFERLMGISAAVGKTIRSLVPNHESILFEVFGRVARTGTPERLERAGDPFGGWFEVKAFRVGAAAQRHVAVLFDDIHHRKRAEAERDALRVRLLHAEEEERRRLARELHDEAGQHLTALALGLKSLSDIAAPGSEIEQRAGVLRALSDTLSRELHAVAVRLRPRALDEFGLEPALRSYAADWSHQTNIVVNVHTASDAPRLPDHIESAVYRIVQEALTNVARHAAATSVSVIVERHGGAVVLAVEDDGRGFDVSTDVQDSRLGGLGLRGIRERVALLGGTVDIESRVGAGTTLVARIPISDLERLPHLSLDRALIRDRENV